MLRLTRKSTPQAKIPDASMADVAFLLIIFFLVTKSFYNVDKTPVALPAAHDRVRVEIPAKGAITIAVTSKAEIRIDGRPATMLDVQNTAETAVVRDPETWFVVRADFQVEYRVVDELLDRLRVSKAANITLETRSGGGGFGR